MVHVLREHARTALLGRSLPRLRKPGVSDGLRRDLRRTAPGGPPPRAPEGFGCSFCFREDGAVVLHRHAGLCAECFDRTWHVLVLRGPTLEQEEGDGRGPGGRLSVDRAIQEFRRVRPIAFSALGLDDLARGVLEAAATAETSRRAARSPHQ